MGAETGAKFRVFGRRVRSCKGDGKSGSETAENRLWVTGKLGVGYWVELKICGKMKVTGGRFVSWRAVFV